MRILMVSMFLLMTTIMATAVELAGDWRVDEGAAPARLHARSEFGAQMERELPTLLQQMGPISFRVATEMRGEPTEIRVEMLSMNQMRIVSEHDEEMCYLIWSSLDQECVSMGGLAAR